MAYYRTQLKPVTVLKLSLEFCRYYAQGKFSILRFYVALAILPLSRPDKTISAVFCSHAFIIRQCSSFRSFPDRLCTMDLFQLLRAGSAADIRVKHVIEGVTYYLFPMHQCLAPTQTFQPFQTNLWKLLVRVDVMGTWILCVELLQICGIDTQPGISIQPLSQLLSTTGIIRTESDTSIRLQGNRRILQNIMSLSLDFSLSQLLKKN